MEKFGRLFVQLETIHVVPAFEGVWELSLLHRNGAQRPWLYTRTTISSVIQRHKETHEDGDFYYFAVGIYDTTRHLLSGTQVMDIPL